MQQQEQPPIEAVAETAAISDGEWHRLHPATPLLRGGIALLAILAFVLNSLRDRVIAFFTNSGYSEGDPVDWILDAGYAPLALAAIAGGLLLFVGVFYLSWRMHTFRITDEVVEVRSGILFRTNRRGRLDRIQGINIVRPFFARLFGAAKLEVNVAGQDANVQLAYLSSSYADELRRDILRLASGTQQKADAAAAAAQPHKVIDGHTVIDQRVNELLAPELDPDAAPPESIVKMNMGRLIGSIVLNDVTVIFLLIFAGAVVALSFTGEPVALIAAFPVLLGLGSFVISRFTKSLRYSIAGTPDGVRVGFGLLSTSNETLPPGRIHSIQVSQPLLWRPAGWWEIKVNRASKSSAQGAAGQQNTTILPVGNLDDVMRVLALMLPGLVDEASVSLLRTGMISKGGDDGFVNSPRRAAPLRWFSWRRNGYAFVPGVTLLRKGAVWRELVLVPQPRTQSVAINQGPISRRLGLAVVNLHTVAGPISARLGAVDAHEALRFFDDVSRAVVESASSDTSHRWRSGEVTP
jgi:putative membrane protein